VEVRSFFLLPLVAAAAIACGTARPGATEVPAPGAKTSLELIADAAARGELDADTAVLYRVYAVKDASKLPAPYRSSRPAKDGTAVLREAQAKFGELRPDVQQAVRPYLFPKGEP
jgi:hypothetical protein